MKKLKVSVIGAGNMGKNHVRTYFELPEVELAGIADVNETLGKSVSEHYKAPFYRDYKEMIEVVRPDLISICVPTIYHYPVSDYCIRHSINVLLEKPISNSIEEAQNLLKLARKKKIKFLVGHIERFNPAVKKVKEMISNNELGKVIAVIARRVGGFPPQIKDADIGIDLAIHDVDIVNYLLNESPREIYVNKQKNHIIKRADSIELFMRYKSASAYIQSNWITPVKIRKLNITGTEGYLEMDYINQNIEFYKSNYKKLIEKTDGFSDYVLRFSETDKININVGKKEPLKEEILFLIDSIINNRKIDSSFALEALKIVMKD